MGDKETLNTSQILYEIWLKHMEQSYASKNDTNTWEEPDNKSDPGDPCNSYTWSILFCIVMIMGVILWIITAVQVILSRGGKYSGLDLLLLLLAVATFVQFGTMFSSSLHVGHSVYSYTQSSCKLMFYTEYGTRSVIASLVVAITAYTYLGMHQGFESVDCKVKTNMGWLVLLAFAIQGLFGIAPAVYVDYNWYWNACVWAYGVSTTTEQIAMELILRPILPYIIPSFLLIYPLVKIVNNISNIDEPNRRAIIKIACILSISYIAMNSLYAVILIAEYVMQIKTPKNPHENPTLCNFKWVFFLLHQLWFVAAPLTVLFVDPALGNLETIQQKIPVWKNKLLGIYDDRVRLV